MDTAVVAAPGVAQGELGTGQIGPHGIIGGRIPVPRIRRLNVVCRIALVRASRGERVGCGTIDPDGAGSAIAGSLW